MTLRTGQITSPEAPHAPRGPRLLAWGALGLSVGALVLAGLALRAARTGGGAASAAGLDERFDAEARRRQAEVQDAVKRAVAKSEETLGRAEKKLDEVREALRAAVADGLRRSEATAESGKARAEALEERVKEMGGLVTRLRADVDRLGAATRGEGPAPGSEKPPGTAEAPPASRPGPPAVEADPVTPKPSPDQLAGNKEKVRAAVADLASPDVNRVFPACSRLAELGDLEAVDPLVRVLKEYPDPYGRSAAASALGALHACDAVAALVGAFADKDDEVALAAARAFTRITGQDPKLADATTREAKAAATERWTAWWKEHEAEVRARWSQPAGAGAGGAPAPATPPASPGK